MVHTNKYCVGATRGSIELSKGNYLALARKKDHLFKVCQRIICFVKKNKKIGKVTVKCKPKFSKARQQLQGAITYRPHVFTDCEMFW